MPADASPPPTAAPVPAAPAEPPAPAKPKAPDPHGHAKASTAALTLGALGVVFGDIDNSWAWSFVPATCLVLVVLFAVQRRGTGSVGKLFGPIMVVYFVTIGALGAYHLAQRPEVLWALSPHHGVRFFLAHGMPGFL